MDDTILLSTTRDVCIKKLQILCDFCNRTGMQINSDKTKFMVINGCSADRVPLSVADVSVDCWEQYTHLASVFTQDGSVVNENACACKATTSD